MQTHFKMLNVVFCDCAAGCSVPHIELNLRLQPLGKHTHINFISYAVVFIAVAQCTGEETD